MKGKGTRLTFTSADDKEIVVPISDWSIVPRTKPITIEFNPFALSTMVGSIKSCSLCRHAATHMTQDPCKTCWKALPKGSYPSYVARDLQTQVGGVVPYSTGWKFFTGNADEPTIVIGKPTEPPECKCEVWINNCSCGRFEWDEAQKKK